MPGAGTPWSVLQDKVKKLELDRNARNADWLPIDDHAHTGVLDQPDGFAQSKRPVRYFTPVETAASFDFN